MKQQLISLAKNKFVHSNIISSTATVIGMGLAYLFNIFMARSLSLAEYGLLSVAVGYLAIATMPAASFSTVLTREFSRIAGEEGKIAFLARKYVKKALAYGFVAALLLSLTGIYFGRYELAMIFLVVPISYAAIPLSSILQAKEKILEFSLANLGGTMLKLAFGFLLVTLGFGLLGAAASLFFPGIIVFSAMYLYLRNSLKNQEEVKVSFRGAMLVMVAVTVLQGFFLYANLFAVQYFLGNAQAGEYNVADTTAKIILYLSGALAVVLYPRILSFGANAKLSQILKFLAPSCALLLPVLAFFLLFPNFMILFFYGQKFLPVEHVFQQLSIGVFIFSCFNYMQFILVARGDEKKIAALWAFALLVHVSLLIFLVPQFGMQSVAWAFIISSCILLIGSSAMLLAGKEEAGGKKEGA